MAVDLPASEEEAVPSTRCSSEESEAREKTVEEINEVPVYQHNHLLNGKFTVVERVGFNDRVGGTYWAVHDDKVLLPDKESLQEMIIRVDKKGGCAVKNEANFLIKMEKANRWRLFSQVHSTWEDAEGRFHLALFFRPGPTLKQCQFFGRPFSLGTAGRFTEDLFAIVEAVHALSFLLRCINADMLHFDANSRHLFLADVSTVRVDPAKANLDVTTSWEGGSLFGPLSADKGEPLTAAGDLEAALFFAISLVVDALPWQDCYAETVGHHKEQAIADGTLFGPLPLEFREAHALIADHEEALDETVYERLRGLAKNIYKDLDENFDFEREPTEDELPRFVLEKKPRGEDATGDLVVDDDGIPTLPLS